MGATFTYAAIYNVTAQCRTPLRTGGADGDTETVLRAASGQAFLQGASLAGALRGWLAENVSPAVEERLMGSQKTAGRLIVSDGRFDPDCEQYTRPRLRIDPASGSAADGGKFDLAHIGAGAKLRFTLTWLGARADADELAAVEQMLAAMDGGEIRLGAQKSNGFGRVALTVTKRCFDMADEKDRQAWLDDAGDGAPLALPEVKNRREVIFTVTGRADNILIRAAAPEQEENGSYTPNQAEGGQPVLPGSSIKGAVRARAEAIARLTGLDGSQMEALFGRGAGAGDNGRAGRVRFEDMRMEQSGKRKITRIRINKFTGGAIRGGLFKEEPVSGPVALRIAAPEEPLGCALLLFTLRDLGLGLFNLGSGGAIGRGYLAVDTIEAAAPDGRRATLKFDRARTCALDDPEGLAAEWLKVWGGTANES